MRRSTPDTAPTASSIQKASYPSACAAVQHRNSTSNVSQATCRLLSEIICPERPLAPLSLSLSLFPTAQGRCYCNEATNTLGNIWTASQRPAMQPVRLKNVLQAHSAHRKSRSSLTSTCTRNISHGNDLGCQGGSEMFLFPAQGGGSIMADKETTLEPSMYLHL